MIKPVRTSLVEKGKSVNADSLRLKWFTATSSFDKGFLKHVQFGGQSDCCLFLGWVFFFFFFWFSCLAALLCFFAHPSPVCLENCTRALKWIALLHGLRISLEMLGWLLSVHIFVLGLNVPGLSPFSLL